MHKDQFDRVVASARARQDELLRTKGADYTRHGPDRLANFKRLAVDLGVDPLVVWAIYAGKHWDAIMAYAKTGQAESEAIRGRLDDLVNYLYLLEGLITERDGYGTPPQDRARLVPSSFGDDDNATLAEHAEKLRAYR